MEIIETTVFALLLYLNGNMIEHVYKPDLGYCLKSKRIAQRELNPERVVFKCVKAKVKLELDPQARHGKRIVKMLDEKY
tara:strand:- start:46 stop:282 length:237 start_codon:yes stop_codon:yes gene_type:complete